MVSQLAELYPDADQGRLADRLLDVFGLDPTATTAGPDARLTAADAILITYADTLYDPKEPGPAPLMGLRDFVARHLVGAVNTVHVLPFYPASSDGGFAVIDHCAVDPELGTWPDVEAVARDVRLMVDVVINHASAESSWFQQFRAGRSRHQRGRCSG